MKNYKDFKTNQGLEYIKDYYGILFFLVNKKFNLEF